MKTALFSLLIIILTLSGCTQTQDTSNLENQIQTLQTENTKLNTENILLNENASIPSGVSENFLETYILAINSLNAGYVNSTLASVNYTVFIECASDDSCTGDDFSDHYNAYYVTAIDSFVESKDFLNRSKLKLEEIKAESPSEFYTELIELRLEQIRLLNETNFYEKIALESYYNSAIAENDEEAEAEYEIYIENIEKFNKAVEDFLEISNQIDLKWDQDWYPNTFIE